MCSYIKEIDIQKFDAIKLIKYFIMNIQYTYNI